VPGVYIYLFSKAADEGGPMKSWGAFHGSELPFIFGNYEFMGIKFASKKNNAVGADVMAYWTAFARTGVPEVEGLPAWPAFDKKSKQYIQLDLNITTGSDLRRDECSFFDSIFKDRR